MPSKPSLNFSRICWRCRARLASTLSQPPVLPSPAAAASIPRAAPTRWQPNFFAPSPRSTFTPSYPFHPTSSPSVILSRSAVSYDRPDAATATTAATATPHISGNEDLPHRRRQARRKAQFQEAKPPDGSATLPPDASAVLSAAAAAAPASSLKRTLSALLSLSKPRLTVLVVLTAMVPYALYPSPDLLSPSLTETPSLSPLTLLFLTTGTALCSASANALNMLYEPSTDALMTRTRNRPLVRALLSTRAAVIFAFVSGVVGVAALYFGVNPTVSFLGASNIVLYAGIYTPLKPISAVNTWVGALVGGIPPLMGWAAAAGETASDTGSWKELLFHFPTSTAATRTSTTPGGGRDDVSSAGGWLLAGFLFAWQFPHFMALSWPIRDEYKRAGLRMLCWVNPARNARVALRYSLVFVPLCIALCAAGITEWSFAITSLPVNGWLAWQAARFWQTGGHAGTARGLFWASVWHLPVTLVLALLQKKDMWSRVWRSVIGEDEDDGGWVYIDEDEDETERVGSPKDV